MNFLTLPPGRLLEEKKIHGQAYFLQAKIINGIFGSYIHLFQYINLIIWYNVEYRLEEKGRVNLETKLFCYDGTVGLYVISTAVYSARIMAHVSRML